MESAAVMKNSFFSIFLLNIMIKMRVRFDDILLAHL